MDGTRRSKRRSASEEPALLATATTAPSNKKRSPNHHSDGTRSASASRGPSPVPPQNNKKRRSNGGSANSSRNPTPVPGAGTASTATNNSNTALQTFLQELEPLPASTPHVKRLTKTEVEELETILEFRSPESPDDWREDWGGNLAFFEKDISNPAMLLKKAKNSSATSSLSGTTMPKTFRQPLLLWASNTADATNRRLLHNLLRYVCCMENVPNAAKKILLGGVTNETPVDDVIYRIRRASYDPQVLKEDGWTTVKSDAPIGASGGPYLIGTNIRCDGGDAVVIAYVHDEEFGDLWKAVWLDDQISFDLEAEEMLEAKKKWERRYNISQNPAAAAGGVNGSGGNNNNGTNKSSRRTTRVSVNSDFTVKGVEYGIVLGSSYSKGARPGVYWPARVMHASERGVQSGARRNISKQKLDLVFLAPYWKSDDYAYYHPGPRKVDSMSEAGESLFNANPLLMIETVDATGEMIQEYPFSSNKGLDLAQLQMSFRFTGLPKSAFRRYVDAHRLAMGLRHYAKRNLKSQFSETDRASAGLFETHPMAVQAPTFPSVILHLPFDFILSQLPSSFQEAERTTEPTIILERIVDSMKPPLCWGESKDAMAPPSASKRQIAPESGEEDDWLRASFQLDIEKSGEEHSRAMQSFVRDFPLLNRSFSHFASSPPLASVLTSITSLLTELAKEEETDLASLSAADRHKKLKRLVSAWSLMKIAGEESLATLLGDDCNTTLVEWRRAAERIYSFVVTMFSGKTLGNGISCVITDLRCNLHRTSDGCFERSVRLPAALRGAKLAGAGTAEATRLVTSVPDQYIELVEQRILERAHNASYLKRMKSRCAAAVSDDQVLILTDGSNGEGGEDTRGCRGTWAAAVAGVGAAIYGVDLVFHGDCVNAFCVTRPPGHHAGREIHPMKAVSNGFCILNTVACAAIYATTPISDGGLGLSRVCVIDFDVHHGNGTQDILCSTYDSRFLYVSLHAGGAEINGHAMEDDPNHELHDLGSNPKMSAIYPGRCGDKSPHRGVLNIPLGEKVTPHAVGTALLSDVSPRVEAFAPDLIILSAGFDAHKHDPMGLGGLRAEDFGHITQVACQLAFKLCSGRLISVLEGGYGVPCCRPQEGTLLSKYPVRNDLSPIPGPEGIMEDAVKDAKSASPQPNASNSDAVKDNIFASLPALGSSNQSALTDNKLVSENSHGLSPDLNVEPGATVGADPLGNETPGDEKGDDNSGAQEVSEVTKPWEVVEDDPSKAVEEAAPVKKRPQPSKLLELGEDLPDNMDDQVPYALQVRLEKCHAEGFVECVQEHVKALSRCNKLN